jgi:hypothetical protein
MDTFATQNTFTRHLRMSQFLDSKKYSSKYSVFLLYIKDIYDEPIPQSVEGFGYLDVMNDIYDVMVIMMDQMDGHLACGTTELCEIDYFKKMIGTFHYFLKNLEKIFVWNMSKVVSRILPQYTEYLSFYLSYKLYEDIPDERIHSYLPSGFTLKSTDQMDFTYFGPVVNQIHQTVIERRISTFDYTEMVYLLMLVQDINQFRVEMRNLARNTELMNYLYSEHYDNVDDFFMNMPQSAYLELMERLYNFHLTWKSDDRDVYF